ncbi:MAG: hypothetical protein H6686_01350 [Fibrobacteria bacterium]|nr:hypothetical protein [Fibrobacteria bacterium]
MISHSGSLRRFVAILCSASCLVCAGDLKVACIGNSLTFGAGLSDPAGESYPTQLGSLLGPGFQVTNYGVSGKTMIRAVGDAYWAQPAFGQALASQPDAVVIELGTNDSKGYIWPYHSGEFAGDYRSMIDTFRVLPSRPEVWVTLQPWANNLSWNMPDTTIERHVNPAILEVAMAAAAPIIDLRSGMSGHPEWFQADSVHPNAAGAKAMAALVADMLLRPVMLLEASGGVLSAPAGFGYAWYRDGVLLPGESERTLLARIPGVYRASVKIDPSSQSRMVSAPLPVSVTRIFARSPLAPQLRREKTGRTWSVRPESGTTLVLLDLDGRALPPRSLGAGVYLFRLESLGGIRTGRLVLP